MIRIAYCDDSPIQQDMLKEWLNFYMVKRGVTLDSVAFSSGDELLEAIEAGDGFDVYIMDIILPGKHGTEIASEIMNINPDAKIIFLTATTAFENSEEADDAFGYLVKPVSYEQLYLLLDKALNE